MGVCLFLVCLCWWRVNWPNHTQQSTQLVSCWSESKLPQKSTGTTPITTWKILGHYAGDLLPPNCISMQAIATKACRKICCAIFAGAKLFWRQTSTNIILSISDLHSLLWTMLRWEAEAEKRKKGCYIYSRNTIKDLQPVWGKNKQQTKYWSE